MQGLRPGKTQPFKNARRFAIKLHQLRVVIAAQREALKSRRRGLAQELQHRARIRPAVDIIAEQEDKFRPLNTRGVVLDAAMRLDKLVITSVNIAHRVHRSEVAFGKRQPSAPFAVSGQYRYLSSPRPEIVK